MISEQSAPRVSSTAINCSRSRSASREPVKKSSCILKLSRKLLRASQDVQIVDDGTAAQIEEILARSVISSASALPPTNMGKCMFNRYAFAQFDPSRRGLLALS